MEIQKDFLEMQIAYEKNCAIRCNCSYEELKAQLDNSESLFGTRYLEGSPRHENWLLWVQAWQEAQTQAIAENTLESDCMINNVWFMKGTPVSNLIKHAEGIYKAEAVAQNSKIKFGTDDNEIWWAHDVPYFGEVQMNWIKEDQEWDIFFNETWQGPFDTKSECIKHLEECIAERRAEIEGE